jgi:hypothetical protein
MRGLSTRFGLAVSPLTPTLSPQSKSAIADLDTFGAEVG